MHISRQDTLNFYSHPLFLLILYFSLTSCLCLLLLYTCKEEEYDGTAFCMATDEELAELETPKLKRGPLTKLIGFRDELKSCASVSVSSMCTHGIYMTMIYY